MNFLLASTMQLADFGLAHASRDGSICFEPVNTDIRGTPGLDFKGTSPIRVLKSEQKFKYKKTKTVSFFRLCRSRVRCNTRTDGEERRVQLRSGVARDHNREKSCR